MSLESGTQIGPLCFVLLFGAAIGAMLLAASNPKPGPIRAATNVIGRGTTIVSILAALMLAFLMTSLKTSFDQADHDVRRFSAHLVDLDRALRRAGPPGDTVRETLFRYTTRVMKDIWPRSHPNLRPEDTTTAGLLLRLEDQIGDLEAGNPSLRDAASRELHVVQSIRVDIDARKGASMSPWLVGFLLFWLALTFAGLGLSAPRTPLAITALFLFAVAISGAVFLASDYDTPFDGVIIISTEPIEAALFAMTE